MVNDVFFKRVTRFIHKVNAHFWVVRIHLTTTLINGKEYGFDATRCLRHQTSSPCRCNRQAGNIATTILHHVFIKVGISLLQAQDERIIHLASGVKDLERTTFARHFYRRTIGCHSQRALHINRKISSILSTITQTERCNHITFGSDTHPRTATFYSLLVNLLPELDFCMLHLFHLGVALNLLQNLLNHLQLKVDNVVHQTLCQAHVLAEEFKVK